MSAPTAHEANPFLRSDAAGTLLSELRKATDGRTGDRLSATLRAVTHAGSAALLSEEVDTAIAAIALLLAANDPTLLNGAEDEEGLRGWLHHVDTELTPGRLLAAGAALDRIEIGMSNEWYAAHEAAGTLPGALLAVHRLRDGLHDASGS
jgi:hypothetical protein